MNPLERKKMKRVGWILLIGCMVWCAAECVLRLLGFGSPQILQPSPTLDYIFMPGQSGVYRGCRYAYNRVSMRSDHEIDRVLPPGSRRVIVAGDSIVNGEARTDQADLATTLLDGVDGMAVYNLSACSWGPLNLAAYFGEYGAFNATDLVIVLSDHDLWDDDPTLAAGEKLGLTADFQTHKPFCATWEWIRFYAYPQVRTWLGHPIQLPPLKPQGNLVQRNLEACAALYALPIAQKHLILHRTQREWRAKTMPAGERAFREHAAQHGIQVTLLDVSPETDYLDNIHLNRSGQRRLADTIHALLKQDTSPAMQIAD